MKLTAKNIHHANMVFVLPTDTNIKLDPQEVFGHFTTEQNQGCSYVDDPVMGLRVFQFPKLQLKIIQEKNRLRFEDSSGVDLNKSFLASDGFRLYQAIAKGSPSDSYGFNYDVMVRTDEVIPQQHILANFVSSATIDDVADFGWQFTIRKPNGREQQTYFFKVVSPIEIGLHFNSHFVGHPSSSASLTEAFAESFDRVDTIFQQLNF
jgi:hypothetical protein